MNSAIQGKRSLPRKAAALVVAVLAILAMAIVTVVVPRSADAAAAPKVDLNILVLDDGSAPVAAIIAQADREGAKYTKLDLTQAKRTVITDAYLRVSDASAPHAKFQAVVAANSAPEQLSAAELTALHKFEQEFGVRQVSAYTWPQPPLGLNWPVYSGAIDGMIGTVTDAAKAAGFGYLQGPVTIEDIDPAVIESYGYLASPATELPAGETFTPYLTTPIVDSSGATVDTASLIGVHAAGGREEMIITFGQNVYQTHAAVLGHGILEWLTRGMHFGQYRNYFSVHIDDVFLPDAMWSIDGKCTIGDGCDPTLYPEDAPGATSRMSAADVQYLNEWQKNRGVYLDMVFNGFGSSEYAADNGGSDPVLAAFKEAKPSSFRWVNHTWSHQYLGCLKNETVTPWTCQKGLFGLLVKYASFSDVYKEINDNRTWAAKNGIPINKAELVSGEHSGLKSLPQMTADSPNFVTASILAGLSWTASDASREMDQRKLPLGPYTVPRYPMNVFYNAETKQQETAEYNWIYNSRANGGSGLCEDNPATSTCIEPLDLETGWDSYILPYETRSAFRRVAQSDIRPFFAHQSNLTADRLVYDVANGVLDQYEETYNTTSTPLINPAMATAGQVMYDQASWASSQSRYTATVQGNSVTIKGASGKVPLTMPQGTKSGSASFGSPYAGSLSGLLTVKTSGTTLTLPAGANGYGPKAITTTATAEIMQAPAADVPPTTVVEQNIADSEILPDDSLVGPSADSIAPVAPSPEPSPEVSPEPSPEVSPTEDATPVDEGAAQP